MGEVADEVVGKVLRVGARQGGRGCRQKQWGKMLGILRKGLRENVVKGVGEGAGKGCGKGRRGSGWENCQGKLPLPRLENKQTCQIAKLPTPQSLTQELDQLPSLARRVCMK